MSVVAAFKYRGGERVEEVNLSDPDLNCDENEFVWVGVVEPTAEELASLQRTFDLHPLAVEDAHKAHQLPKLEIYGEQLFIVATTASFHDDTIEYGETAIFVGRKHIVTVRHGSLRDHATQILLAIAKDMRSRQTEVERYVISQGLA